VATNQRQKSGQTDGTGVELAYVKMSMKSVR